MKVYCCLGWDDIIRESKYEYINRFWLMKIGRALDGTWPGTLPEILMVKGEEKPRVGPPVGFDFMERKNAL